MEYKDYYAILGVEKDATADEIKKQYRKLAIQYYPDKNQGNAAAEEKFKTVAEAYEVLGDPEKRKKYDDLGANWKQYEQSGFSGFDFGNYGGTHFRQADFGEFFGGQSGFSDFFDAFFGRGFTHSRKSTAYKGSDLKTEVWISLEEAYNGTVRQLNIDGSRIRVPVKKGVKDGQILRLKGKGSRGSQPGLEGDLLMTIKIHKHPTFTRKQNDLWMEVQIDFYTAVLGGKITLNGLDGKLIVPLKANTQNGSLLRLKGKGMPIYGRELSGNLIIKIQITIPEKMTSKEIELIQQAHSLKQRKK